ncbi:MAG: hypothetical protein RMK89_13685, partial [Armatimonadota bacterium]|nr:hypothetical protein [Armatimonadota bacterium]MDW8144498.1 hypothetical protein [Armatimonadota bacterium]
AVQKWIEAYHANGNGVVNVRGRRSELERAEYSEHAMVLRRLASDSATSHLAARAIWELYLKHFECSVECQASGECPHKTVSYQVALRFLQALPVSFGEQKTRFSKRFRSSHSAVVPPALIWLFDRTKSDILLVKNEKTGEVARFEIAAAIDRGTMTCLALAAVEREAETPKGKQFNPYFDTVTYNALVADALCGELTGVPAKPKVVVVDWGKVENNNAFLSVCKRMRIQLSHARPYDPGSKAEIEAFFSFLHSQLEAFCPGYVGSNNQRAEARPLCTESGKARRQIDSTTGEIYWVDDAGRRLLTVSRFNRVLKEWARRWNAQVSPKWQQPRLSVFQQSAITHNELEEFLRVQLLSPVVRKVRLDGMVCWREHWWFHPILCLYAGFGDYRHVNVRISPDHRAWIFDLQDEPIGGSLKMAQAEEVPIWQYLEGSKVILALENFKREMVRRVKAIVDEALNKGWGVDQTVEVYKGELMAIFENFKLNPFLWLPRQPQPLDDEVKGISDDEYLDLLDYVVVPAAKRRMGYDEATEYWLGQWENREVI